MVVLAASALRIVKLRIPSLCETWELNVEGDKMFGMMVMSSRRWLSEVGFWIVENTY